MKRLNLFWFCILLLGCSDSTDKNSKNEPSVIDFKSITIGDWNDVVESVDLLTLEEKGTLGTFISYDQSDDEYFFKNNNSHSILGFSKKGKFKNEIEHYGDGPEDYSVIWDFWVEGDTLLIFDSTASKLLLYDFKGQFLKSKKLKGFPSAVKKSGNSYFLTKSKSFQNAEIEHFIEQTDLEGRKYVKYFYKDEIKRMNFSWGYNPFQIYKDSITFHDPVSNTIYIKKGEEFAPLLKFDFGKDWYWSSLNKNSHMLNGPELLVDARNSDKIKSFQVFMGEEYMVIQWVYDQTLHTALGDIHEGSIIQFDKELTMDRNIKFRPIKFEKDIFVVSIQADELSFFEDALDEHKIRYINDLHQLQKERQNPILAKIKFKENLFED